MYRKEDAQWWIMVLEQKTNSMLLGIEDTECLAAFMECVLGDGAREGRFKTYERLLNEKFIAPYYCKAEHCYNFKGIRMPEEIWDKENVYWECLDNIAPHLFATEDWESCRQEQFNKALQDGTYIFDKVLVNPGDVVIDAGANLGFFSAYAAYKGGIVHAFEPDRGNRRCLEQTARLNANIAVHHQALMARTSKVAFLEAGNSGSTAVFLDKIAAPIAEIDAITVDDFIQSSSLAKVDFIKADIEGAERMLLTGATRTLQEFAPKLAICTYHSPEDPQLLAKIILTANPRYKVIQGRKKLYAFV